MLVWGKINVRQKIYTYVRYCLAASSREKGDFYNGIFNTGRGNEKEENAESSYICKFRYYYDSTNSRDYLPNLSSIS
jgi:hypothetical protein